MCTLLDCTCWHCQNPTVISFDFAVTSFVFPTRLSCLMTGSGMALDFLGSGEPKSEDFSGSCACIVDTLHWGLCVAVEGHWWKLGMIAKKPECFKSPHIWCSRLEKILNTLPRSNPVRSYLFLGDKTWGKGKHLGLSITGQGSHHHSFSSFRQSTSSLSFLYSSVSSKLFWRFD